MFVNGGTREVKSAAVGRAPFLVVAGGWMAATATVALAEEVADLGCLASGGRGLQCDRAGVMGALFQAALIQSTPRIAVSEEGVPAMSGGLVSPDLIIINALATN